MTKPINFGIIGCANIAQKYMIRAIQDTPGLKLMAIASRNQKKATDFAQRFAIPQTGSYDQLIQSDQLDALYIPLPIGLHYQWARKALQAGKHVLLEKSAVEKYSQAQSLVKFAQKNSLLLMENFMFLHHPQLAKIHTLINQNKIGDIKLIKAWFGFPSLPKDDIRFQAAIGGGSLLDNGTYTLRVSNFFLETGGTNYLISYPNRSQVSGRHLGAAMLKNDHGQVSQIAFGFQNHYQCQLEIWGTKGKISANKIFTPAPDFSPQIIIETQNSTKKIHIKPANHFISLLKTFKKSVQQKSYHPHYQDLLNQAKLIKQFQDKTIHVN